jgi:hypothetical protein
MSREFGVFVSPEQQAVHLESLSTWGLGSAEDIARGFRNTPWLLVFAGREEDARQVASAWQERRNRGDL